MQDATFYILWILIFISIFTALQTTLNEDDVRARTRPSRIRLMRQLRKQGK